MKSVFWLLPLFLFACSHAPRVTPLESIQPRPKGPNCRSLSAADRERILEAADPDKFPATRYRRGPSTAKGIEKEADCSSFVHEIYKRAGLPYGYRPTASLGEAREFDVLPEKQAQPGDLMLFRGHVGIVDDNGKIISALRTRHRRRKTSIAAIDRRHFKTFKGKRYVLRYRCLPNVRQATSQKDP